MIIHVMSCGERARYLDGALRWWPYRCSRAAPDLLTHFAVPLRHVTQTCRNRRSCADVTPSSTLSSTSNWYNLLCKLLIFGSTLLTRITTAVRLITAREKIVVITYIILNEYEVTKLSKTCLLILYSKIVGYNCQITFQSNKLTSRLMQLQG